jgi:hypothetical protein
MEALLTETRMVAQSTASPAVDRRAGAIAIAAILRVGGLHRQRQAQRLPTFAGA